MSRLRAGARKTSEKIVTTRVIVVLYLLAVKNVVEPWQNDCLREHKKR